MCFGAVCVLQTDLAAVEKNFWDARDEWVDHTHSTAETMQCDPELEQSPRKKDETVSKKVVFCFFILFR